MLNLPFYNLRLALLGFILTPVLLVMGISGSWSLQTLEIQVEKRMQEDIELIARAIRLPLSYALEQDRFGSLERALTSAFNIDRVYGVYVYNENGEQIASSGSPEAQVRTEHAARLASEGNRRGEYGSAGDESIFSYFVPLTDRGGRISGLLQVTRRGSDFSDYLSLVRNNFLLALIGMTIILILVVLVGHFGAVGRYLQKIEQGMIHIGSGETDHRIAIKGPSEIRVLARGINDMLDRISRSRKELEKRQARETDLRLKLYYTEKLAAIGQLASGVAHELGTPLSTVDGKAQQLLRHKELPENVRRSVEQIRTESSRMEQIIQQLLDFGRRNPLERKVINCGSLVRSVLGSYTEELEKRDIEIQLEDDLTEVKIPVDRVRMVQAISNLLQNAIQACRRQIRVGWTVKSGEVVISIEDDGAGISEDDRPYVFDPFFTTKPVDKGTGLGLSVAHAAVSDHGGNILIDKSTALGGARFRIILDQENITV